MKLAFRRLHGEATALAESGFFAAILALSHLGCFLSNKIVYLWTGANVTTA